MTCRSSSGVVVCASDGPYRRAIRRCPTCKRRTRHILRWDGPWRGTTEACVTCGDTWMDGELCPRPFKRGWRADSQARWRNIWNNHATPIPVWEQRVKAEIDEVCRPAEQLTETLDLPYTDPCTCHLGHALECPQHRQEAFDLIANPKRTP